MKAGKFKPYILSVLITLAVAFLSGIAVYVGNPAFEQLVKPPLTPPSSVFPVAWTILYVLMGIGAAMIWNSTDEKRDNALFIYAAQLLFNALWSPLFFGLKAYCLSFVWILLIWVLILMMITAFFRISRIAGLIQIPYLLWVTFAAYLNLGICLLNRG